MKKHGKYKGPQFPHKISTSFSKAMFLDVELSRGKQPMADYLRAAVSAFIEANNSDFAILETPAKEVAIPFDLIYGPSESHHAKQFAEARLINAQAAEIEARLKGAKWKTH